MELVFYNETLRTAIESYTLTEEQLQFTISPMEALKLVKKDADRFPILAMEQEKLVTFFILHKKGGVKEFSDNPHAILLRSFSTDFHEQGKGFARQSLMQLPEFMKIHFPEINEIVLCVNSGNAVARRLYEKCGYIDTEERRNGRWGELIVMSYCL
ncbi:GNAT family N-acetyltransferase [Solibacillus sp. FSL H8-0538]|uniref:GNAT family N-acetyltransferase n=1 Tax=Solibacillus sp. FSL H8-0538 TaxID=2921400 RepID=UPI0030FC06E8